MIETPLPCIKNKCILYPVCRNKKYIDCEHLKEYFKQSRINKNSHRRTWEELSKYLPNTLSIKKHRDYISITSYKLAKKRFKK